MERFVEIFKRHPMWIIGAVLGVVILIWLLSRGSSSTGQVAVFNSGPTDAQVQGAYTLQAAQISANAAVAGAQLANEKSANDNQAAITLNSQNTGAATSINATNASAAVQINGQNTGAAVTINQSNNNAGVTVAGYQRDADINGQNVTKDIAGIQSKTALAGASYQAQTALLATMAATNPKGGSFAYTDPVSGQNIYIGLSTGLKGSHG